jgi:hypothetical protein
MHARLIKLAAAVAACAALAIGGSVYASAAHKSSPAVTPAVSQSAENAVVETGNVQQGDQSAPDNTATAENATVDTDNVQQGDQSGNDQATGAEASSTGEQATSESGQSDGPGGYADVNPNANTQQQGEH